jgi:dipeptidase
MRTQRRYRTNRVVMLTVAAVCLAIGCRVTDGLACSSIIVTKGASTDGSVFITYTCDWWAHGNLTYTPAADHQPGDSLRVGSGWIEQVPHTYAVMANRINEHQVATSETTFGGREELRDPDGLFFYSTLMHVALQRSKTARQAILVMGELLEKHGYNATGESFSICDPQEAWIMELIGTGPDGVGANWVARRVPDGYISCHMNKARIGAFPLDDPENCLYSENVVNFAIERGYYDPDSGQPFSFHDAYDPDTPKNRRYGGTRVWSVFRRAAPSQHFSPDYHRGVEGAKPYPLWIKPDSPIEYADILDLMRDHFNGTEYDMEMGVDAGPFGSPNRWRPITWSVDGEDYAWERPIATFNVSHTYVVQVRSWLPNQVGGVLWFSVDDPYTNCYVPMYVPMSEMPRPFVTGHRGEYSEDSLWWQFNFVSNYANLKYSYMIKEIQAVQRELEEEFIALQPAVEMTALELCETDPELATRYLTSYSVGQSELVLRRWQRLAKLLIRKYSDGYISDEKGNVVEPSYSEEYLRWVSQGHPELRLPRDK